MLNDDKPLIEIRDTGVTIYGTPWNGKHRLGTNISLPLKAICILERGENNSIKKIAPYDAISTVITQTLRTNDLNEMDKMLSLTDKLLASVPFYRLKCNMNDDAAVVSYNAMAKS